MFRDKLKKAARKAALKALGMESQAAPRQTSRGEAGEFDPTVIPRVVDGSGDTPGPNHKTLIGRTWISAQLAGGVSPCILDIRPPEQWRAGHLPGALLLPGRQIMSRTDLLPSKDKRVAVCDATGDALSAEVALWLHEAGWTLARQLQGGWAEWVEFGEPIVTPETIEGDLIQIGDTAELTDGRRGWVQELTTDSEGLVFTLLLDYDEDEVAPGLRKEDLEGA